MVGAERQGRAYYAHASTISQFGVGESAASAQVLLQPSAIVNGREYSEGTNVTLRALGLAPEGNYYLLLTKANASATSIGLLVGRLFINAFGGGTTNDIVIPANFSQGLFQIQLLAGTVPVLANPPTFSIVPLPHFDRYSVTVKPGPIRLTVGNASAFDVHYTNNLNVPLSGRFYFVVRNNLSQTVYVASDPVSFTVNATQDLFVRLPALPVGTYRVSFFAVSVQGVPMSLTRFLIVGS